jgi:aspartate/tyrosine/aromatic aminotransferase
MRQIRALTIQRGRGCPLQRGRGIGSIFKGLVRLLAPSVKKSIKKLKHEGIKLIKSDLGRKIVRESKKRLASTGKNILADVIETGDIKKSFQKEINRQKDQLQKDIQKIRKKGADYIRHNPSDKSKKIKRKRAYSTQKKIKRKRISYRPTGDIFS